MDLRKPPPYFLNVRFATQTVEVVDRGRILARFPVSTARNGPGEQKGSGCTPRGWLVVRAKIGEGAPLNAVFVGRRWTGEIFGPELARQWPERDWILTRILWLDGLEPGLNRYGDVHTASRYIYFHGSPDAGVAGTPQSHGCIRLCSTDMLALYDRVRPGCPVLIGAD